MTDAPFKLGKQREILTDYWFKTKNLAKNVISLIDSGEIIQANKKGQASVFGRELSTLHSNAHASLDAAKKLNAGVTCVFEPEVQKFIQSNTPQAGAKVFAYFKELAKSIEHAPTSQTITRIAHSLESLLGKKDTLTFADFDIAALDNQKNIRSRIGPQGKYFLGHLLAQAS